MFFETTENLELMAVTLCHSEHFDRLSALLDSESQTLHLEEMLKHSSTSSPTVQHDRLFEPLKEACLPVYFPEGIFMVM